MKYVNTFVFKCFYIMFLGGKKLNIFIYFRNTLIFDILICLMNLKGINFKCFLNLFDFNTLYLYLMRLLLIQLTTHQETSNHVLLKIFTALRLFEYNHFLKVELQV